MSDKNQLAVIELNEGTIVEAYPVAKAAIEQMAADFMPLLIEADGTGKDEVHAARMLVKETRVKVEHKRKELKRGVLEAGKMIDGVAKELTAAIEPIESHLLREEQTYKEEQERIKQAEYEAYEAKLKAKVQALAEYGYHTTTYDVDAMTDVAYEATLEEARQDYEARKKAEAEARAQAEREEAERKARAEAEAAELAAKQQRLERLDSRVKRLAGYEASIPLNLLEEWTDKEFDAAVATAEDNYNERKAAEAKRQAEADAEAKRLREEREALEAEKAKQRQAERERQEQIEEALRLEEAERKAVEAERERIEREQREAKAREAAEAAEKARLEAIKPDREKLREFANRVEALEVPKLSSDSSEARVEAKEAMELCVIELRTIAANMK